MNKSRIPWIIQEYARIKLYGKEHAGSEIDFEDLNEPWAWIGASTNGLFDQYCAASQESIEYSHQIAYFYCPGCGHDLHCSNDQPFLEYLHKEKAEHLSRAQVIKCEIDLLNRLLDPELMGEAYELMATELSENMSWVMFLEAAQKSRKNYSEFRRLRKRAETLLSEIARSSRNLAFALGDLQSLGVLLPGELKNNTGVRTELLGLGASPEADQLKMLRFIEDFTTHKERPANNQLDLRTALYQVSDVATNWTVDLGSPSIEVAISTRQDSQKSAYLRAFGAMLKESRISLNPPIKRSMAIAANVVMDDANLSISEDDVRKALGRTKAKRAAKTEKKPRSRKTRAFKSA